MTREEQTIANLKKLKSFHNGSYGTDIDRAIKALEQEPKTFKWCTDCREYNQEKHCCYRYSKVIRNTVEEMKQEPTLSIDDVMSVFDDFMCGEVDEDGTETFLEMLKDKAEIEP